LRIFPLDKLKIDRSFISGLDGTMDAAGPHANAEAIVQAIIQLARALNLKTTAEGVETITQRDMLQRMGCTQSQGFLTARPMGMSATQAFIAAWPQTGASLLQAA
jgi:EAL domain-containing protein (putative c-di-GMP-specific phosphodiesterase class I)